jgi:pyridoxal phosphate enzyme (YggS family)
MSSSTDIGRNIAEVTNRIAQAARKVRRDVEEVTLVTVTKTIDVERVQVAYEHGIRHFGENRVQEAVGKIGQLDIPATWHMIGHLQTNKAKDAVRLFDVIQSIDSVHVARAVSRHAQAASKLIPILLEVNTSGEPQKYGFRPEEVANAAREVALLPSLRIEGLMTVAPLVTEPEEARPFFRKLRELRDQLKTSLPNINWQHLSMGMTDDFEVAIEEGATLVRIGRAIFGERQPGRQVF